MARFVLYTEGAPLLGSSGYRVSSVLCHPTTEIVTSGAV